MSWILEKRILSFDSIAFMSPRRARRDRKGRPRDRGGGEARARLSARERRSGARHQSRVALARSIAPDNYNPKPCL